MQIHDIGSNNAKTAVLLMSSKLRVSMKRMPVLRAELTVPLHANAHAFIFIFIFKDLHAWCSFSLRCDDVLPETTTIFGFGFHPY